MSFFKRAPSHRATRVALALALTGAALQALGMVASAWAYSRASLEPYSCLNHFISELGWPERSSLARLFNLSLCLGSLLFAPLIDQLGCRTRNWLGPIGTGLGVVTILCASAVGVFPIMKHLAPHLRAAFLFFSGWGLTALVFTVAFSIGPQAGRSKLLLTAGLLGVSAAAAFLFYPKGDLPTVLAMLKSTHRPALWWPAVLEWGVLASFYFWVLAACRLLWREPN